MNYRRLSLLALSASIIAGVGLGGTSFAAAGSDRPDAANISQDVAGSASVDALEYWTPERMASAKPADLVGPVSTEDRSVSVTQPAGNPVVVAPAKGAAIAGGETPSTSVRNVPVGPDHASYVPRYYNNYPDALNGKVFFTKQTGGNFVCSGTVVNSPNKSMVDTAGHCVSDGAGRFHLNWIFVPAYSSTCSGCGDTPYGVWSARNLTTKTEWHYYSNFKQDLGYAVLNTRSGWRIVDYIGGQGSAFNQSRYQNWNAYGYPQAYPFNGYDQLVCNSNRLGDDNPNPSRPGPYTLRIHCNQTGGSSGGGWLIWQSGGLGYVNGHNSYRYSGWNDDMWGPYFGSEALSLFDYTKVL